MLATTERSNCCHSIQSRRNDRGEIPLVENTFGSFPRPLNTYTLSPSHTVLVGTCSPGCALRCSRSLLLLGRFDSCAELTLRNTFGEKYLWRILFLPLVHFSNTFGWSSLPCASSTFHTIHLAHTRFSRGKSMVTKYESGTKQRNYYT